MVTGSSLSDGNRHAPRLVEMKACEGNRMGSNLFYPVDNTGYLYRVKRKRGNTLYFSCARNGCKATANFKRKKFPNTKKGTMKGLFEITSCHSHSEDPTVLVKLMFESACKKRSMNEETPYSVIIKEEKQKWQIDTVKEAGLISTLYQARKRSTLDGPPLSSASDNSDQSGSEEDDGVQLNAELAYTRYGYRVECWKWVLTHFRLKPTMNTSTEEALEKTDQISTENSLPGCKFQKNKTDDILSKSQQEKIGTKMSELVGEVTKMETQALSENYPLVSDISEALLLRAYGLHRLPLFFPCVKRCPLNPFCLTGYKIGTVIKGGSESKLPPTQQPRPAPNFPVGLQSCTPASAVAAPALLLLFHLRRFRNAINSLDDISFDTSLDSLAHLLQVLFAEMETHAFKTIACDEGSVLDRITTLEDHRSVVRFLEATIDWLVAETDLAPTIAPLFAITTTKNVKWQCSRCSAVHEEQLSPTSSYRLHCSAQRDQDLLATSLVEFAAAKEFGVQMVCGGQRWSGGGQAAAQEGGCGHLVRADREVLTKMVDPPHYLLIENAACSLPADAASHHVVFPEHLNLTQHAREGRPTHYVLSGVVFADASHGAPATCQLKVSGGRWFSFHGDQVVAMTNKDSFATQSQPHPAHPNHMSDGGVSVSYRGRAGVRVSRGVQLWVYTLVDMQPAPPFTPPRASVLNYINSHESQESKQRFRVQAERQELLKNLSVRSKEDLFVLLQEALLAAWTSTEEQRFVLPPQLLLQQKDLLCSHGKIKPFAAHKFKCIRKEMAKELLNTPCGINISPTTPENHDPESEASCRSPPGAQEISATSERPNDVHCVTTCGSQPEITSLSTNCNVQEPMMNASNVSDMMPSDVHIVTSRPENGEVVPQFTGFVSNGMHTSIPASHASLTSDFQKEKGICSSGSEVFYSYTTPPMTTSHVALSVDHQNSVNSVSMVTVLPISGTNVLPVSAANVLPISATNVLPISGTNVLPISANNVLPISGTNVLPVSAANVLPISGTNVLPVSTAFSISAASALPLAKTPVICVAAQVPQVSQGTPALPFISSTVPPYTSSSHFLPPSYLKESAPSFESSLDYQMSTSESQATVPHLTLRNEEIYTPSSTAAESELSNKSFTSNTTEGGFINSTSPNQDPSEMRPESSLHSDVQLANPPNEATFSDLKLENESHRNGGGDDQILWSPSNSLCVECVAEHARFIRFLEMLRRLHRQFRREAVRHKTSGCKLMGALSLDNWPKIAAKKYIVDHKIDIGEEHSPTTLTSPSKFTMNSSSGAPKTQVEDSSRPHRNNDSNSETVMEVSETNFKPQTSDPDCRAYDGVATTAEALNTELSNEQLPNVTAREELSKEQKQDSPKNQSSATQEQELLNEDIVCDHNELNPQSYVSWLPEDSYGRILQLCDGFVHKAVLRPSFDLCVKCQDEVIASETACSVGLDMKRRLNALFLDKRRPLLHRDVHKKVFLLDRVFVVQWRNYIRKCMKGVAGAPPRLPPHRLLCPHHHLAYAPRQLPLYRQTQLWVLLWAEEWLALTQLYSEAQGYAVGATIGPDGSLETQPGPCLEGCVESRAEAELESLYVYEDEVIEVLRVASVQEILPLLQPPLAGQRLADGGLKSSAKEMGQKEFEIFHPESKKLTRIEGDLKVSNGGTTSPENEHELSNCDSSTAKNFHESEGAHENFKGCSFGTESSLNTANKKTLSGPVSELWRDNLENKFHPNDKEQMLGVALHEASARGHAGCGMEVDEEQPLKTERIPSNENNHPDIEPEDQMMANADGSSMETVPAVSVHQNQGLVNTRPSDLRESTPGTDPETSRLHGNDSDRKQASADHLLDITTSGTDQDFVPSKPSIKNPSSDLDVAGTVLSGSIEEKCSKNSEESKFLPEANSIDFRNKSDDARKIGIVGTENGASTCAKTEDFQLETSIKPDRNKDNVTTSAEPCGDDSNLGSRARGRPKGISTDKPTTPPAEVPARPSRRRRRAAALVGEEERRYASEEPSLDRLRLRVSSGDSLKSLLSQVQRSTAWPAPLRLWLPRLPHRLCLPPAGPDADAGTVTAADTGKRTIGSENFTAADTDNGTAAVADTGTPAVAGTGTAAVADTGTAAVADTGTAAVADTGTAATETPTTPALPADAQDRLLALQDYHLNCSLAQLRLKPDDTLYFQVPVQKSPEAEPCGAAVPCTQTKPSRQKRSQKAGSKKTLKKTTAKSSPASPSAKRAPQSGGGVGKKKVQTGRTVELHVTEGSRLGSQLVYPADDTGYVYRVKRIKKTTIYFSCGYTGCRACGNFKKKGDSMIGVFDLTSHHNHKRNPTHLRRLKFESVCKKRNLEEDLPASVIIKEELARWQLREEDVNLHTLNSTLYKARWRLAVDDPSSVPDVTQPSYPSQLEAFAPKQEKHDARNMMFPSSTLPPSHLQPQPHPPLDRF